MRGIGVWPNDHKIVVHHVATVDAVPLRYELVLAGAIMDEQNVGVAAFSYRKGLTRTDRHNMNIDAGCSFKNWQDVVE